MSKLLKPFCEAAEPERGGISIPHRRSTDPESPTFEPTVMLTLNGKAYYVHLDVWREIERLNSSISDSESLVNEMAQGLREWTPHESEIADDDKDKWREYDECCALLRRAEALTGVQRLGDCAGAESAITGSPGSGTKAATVATKPSPGVNSEERAYAENMFDALYRLRKWDHLDTAADGPYWKLVIDAALAKNPAKAAPASSGRDTSAAERLGHAPASAGPGHQYIPDGHGACSACGVPSGLHHRNSSSGSFTNPKEK